VPLSFVFFLGGGGALIILGFIDRDKTSTRCGQCRKDSGLNVYSLGNIENFDGSVILVFGIHADEICRSFESYGLTEGRHFEKLGGGGGYL
jgi:hypothetical protein